MGELSERMRRQVAVTIAYLADNKIDPHFAEVLMSHYLDFAREIEDAARSEAQPSGYDGSKSLGERLYEAVQKVLAPSIEGPWPIRDHATQSRYERIALTFTASLSDAFPKPSSDEQET